MFERIKCLETFEQFSSKVRLFEHGEAPSAASARLLLLMLVGRRACAACAARLVRSGTAKLPRPPALPKKTCRTKKKLKKRVKC